MLEPMINGLGDAICTWVARVKPSPEASLYIGPQVEVLFDDTSVLFAGCPKVLSFGFSVGSDEGVSKHTPSSCLPKSVTRFYSTV